MRCATPKVHTAHAAEFLFIDNARKTGVAYIGAPGTYVAIPPSFIRQHSATLMRVRRWIVRPHVVLHPRRNDAGFVMYTDGTERMALERTVMSNARQIAEPVLRA